MERLKEKGWRMEKEERRRMEGVMKGMMLYGGEDNDKSRVDD